MVAKESKSSLKLFNRDSFPLFSFVILFILCLVLMGLDYRQQILKEIKSRLSITVSPIIYLINVPANIFITSKNNFISKIQLEDKIKNLEQTNYSLSISVQENKLIKAENKILRNKLKIEKDFNIVGINAEIILPKVKNGYSIITIDKGLKGNIKIGSGVINNTGLVGQIINVSNNYSEIMPITSDDYAVPAIMDSSKENIIVYGDGNGGLKIPLFPASSSISINDTFVTSGVGGSYPKGIKIARVVEIIPTKSPKFNFIVLAPFSQPTTFTQITVLTTKK